LATVAPNVSSALASIVTATFAADVLRDGVVCDRGI
jgi:hypothetical protein